MDDDNPKDRFGGKLPSANDLARLLKNKIKNYAGGGMEGVWRQLDGRFKRDGGKAVTGLKGFRDNRISHAAFKKAFQRLGAEEDSVRLEKMRFQVDGNPLLLMNIFEILGINGYKDLLETDFRKPDAADEIFSINLRLRRISRTLTDISERMETGHKSVNTFKLNADFEEFTKRLHFVLLYNKDPLLKDFSYYTEKDSALSEFFLNISKFGESGDIQKMRRMHKELEKKYESVKYFSTVKNEVIYTMKEENRRAAMMFMMFFDYSGYAFRSSILREYRRQLKIIDISRGDFNFNHTCVLSPFFTIFLYLQIAILFVSRTDEASFRYEGHEKDKILKIIGKDNMKTHLLCRLKRLFREIRALLKFLITNQVKDIPQKNYDKYKENAGRIIGILKIIFIDNKKDNPENLANIINKYKTPEALFKIKDRVYSGIYTVSYSGLVNLESVINDILEVQRATARDLND